MSLMQIGRGLAVVCGFLFEGQPPIKLIPTFNEVLRDMYYNKEVLVLSRTNLQCCYVHSCFEVVCECVSFQNHDDQ